ncbi:hypothetical protein [Halorhabdus amylolytica]|uniref:hypothetical protein n=1 Tax=Halorhabdus amylolytica TaxID=2559573 RepID=UPI0010AAFED9|nr:hypothetical protein [Halorhabdus amylolytica]
MSVQIEGFEELADSLDDLQQHLEGVSGENEIPMDELFPDSFMRTHTDFDSVDELFDSSPWEFDTKEDFKQIPESEFDDYIDAHTGFSSWEAMLTAAAREWITRQLDF